MNVSRSTKSKVRIVECARTTTATMMHISTARSRNPSTAPATPSTRFIVCSSRCRDPCSSTRASRRRCAWTRRDASAVLRSAAAASAIVGINSSGVWQSTSGQPAAAQALTSVALCSSSGNAYAEARSVYCSSKWDSNTLASAWSTSGTTGLTSQRNGQAAEPVVLAAARPSRLCSTRTQQPRQKRWPHESLTGRNSSSRQMGQE
eukprot:scaffold10185_cov66-Phaeocystis_antarctica.AAC.3